MNSMHTKHTLQFLLILLCLINCHDSKNTSSKQVSAINKNVGLKIPMDVAERWISRYRKANSARSEQIPNITPESIAEILDPVDERLGLSFHRAIDPSGNYHILVAPVNQNVPFLYAGKIFDATTSSMVNLADAEQWSERYKTENSAGIWSHFFGTHVFEQAFSSIQLQEALNDNNIPQLLLFIWRDDASSNGRTNGTTVDVYDASGLCPNLCSPSQI